MDRPAAASAIEANAACRGGQQQDLGTKRRELDREARLTISAELGHEGEQITAVCLGR
jgi:hypothetical protein